MRTTMKTLVAAVGLATAAAASAQVTFFANEGMRGPAFTADRQVWNFERWGFNDRASSAVVDSGNWQVCEDAGFNGRCVILQPGQYPELKSMGMDNRISSVRPVDAQVGYYDDRRYAVAAPPAPDYDRWRRHGDERLFEVPVRDVRAVVGPPEQRCWVERQQVVQNSGGGPNVPGAVIGGVLGGILGHQIGEGRGRDVATVGGAVAGAAIGGNVPGGGAPVVSTQDVQRCADVPSSSAVDYYDVTYAFNGIEHHVQMTAPPGRTILVNRDGEPRVQ